MGSIAIEINDGITNPARLQGKTEAIVICWFLGLGSLLTWNSVLTVADYYYKLFSSQDDSEEISRLSNKELLLKNIDFVVEIFLTFVLNMSIFLGFLYENTGQHKLGSWYALVLVAMFNVLDFMGRYIPLIKCVKLELRKGLMTMFVARFLFIPAFYFTVKYGDQGWMIMLTSFLGLTNGYLTVCVLTTAPKGYNGPEANALGNLLVVFLLGGIFAGVALNWLWIIGKEEFNWPKTVRL